MKPKVLVIDGEQIVADTLALILEKHGFQCQAAYTGSQAVAVAENYCPQLLLCDVVLPDADGLDVVSQLSRQCPNCRVLLLIGHYSKLQRAREWADSHSTPCRVIAKPILPDHLLQEMHALLLATP